jgi:hypothetical protein
VDFQRRPGPQLAELRKPFGQEFGHFDTPDVAPFPVPCHFQETCLGVRANPSVGPAQRVNQLGQRRKIEGGDSLHPALPGAFVSALESVNRVEDQEGSSLQPGCRNQQRTDRQRDKELPISEQALSFHDSSNIASLPLSLGQGQPPFALITGPPPTKTFMSG